mgnify:CR=1 FL=1
MQEYLDKLNDNFNKILEDHYNHELWKGFGKTMNECYDNDIRFYYIPNRLFEIKDNPEMLRIKKEMEKLDKGKVWAIKMQSFDYAGMLSERNNELELQLDRAFAKAYYRTENYFYKYDKDTGIGFNFIGDKVIDFLMNHYSVDRYGLTQLRKI